MLGWELLVVLAVFPLPAVVAALQSLASSAVDGARATPYVTLPIPGHLGLSAPLVMAALLLAVAGVHGVKPPEPRNLPIGYLAVFVLASIVTAVAEEVVVLGYLVRRLEQRGWRPAQVVAVAAAVRISYHLYYGIGVLPIAVWAVLSVVLYRTYRRLPAFIVVHAVWDATLFARAFVGSGVVPLVALLVGVPSIVLWGVERQRRAAEQRAAAGMPYPLAPCPGAAQLYPGTAHFDPANPPVGRAAPRRRRSRSSADYPRTASPGASYSRTAFVGQPYPVVPEPVPPAPPPGPSSSGAAPTSPWAPAAASPPGPGPGPGPSAPAVPASLPPPGPPPPVPPPA